MQRAFALLGLMILPIAPAAGPATSPAAEIARTWPIAPAAAAETAWAWPIAPAAAAAGTWTWPVDPPHAIVRPFIAPPTPYAAGHRGIDIRAPTAVVYAPTAGVVHFAGFVVDRPVLSIRHPGGLITSYEPVSTQLVAGQTVRRGEVIGTVEPGHCAQRCLHFGVRLDGEYVSPLKYLGELPFSVLLPTRRG